MSHPSEPLLAPTFLFRFAVPCQFRRTIWSDSGVTLGPAFRLPSFGELEKRPLFGDLRAAWNRSGLAFTLCVAGKKRPPVQSNGQSFADGLHVWLDTRHTYDVHRATRYAHHFVFGLPENLKAPGHATGRLVPMARAREQAKPVDPKALPMLFDRRTGGYQLMTHIPAGALTGFDPEEHPRLGFTYAVVDQEFGWQTFSTGIEFPFPDDPSLWGTLELTGG